MRRVTAGLVPSGKRPLQEPYSIRCSPQLLGAAEDALRYVDGVVAADLGSVSDNPLFFPDDDVVVHGGNFFGQPAAFAADLLTTVMAQVGNLAERQLDLLVDPHRNGGLPPMLAAGPGRQHGLQGVQLASTALIAEIRRDTMPASMQSIPTNLHNQDVVPLGNQAALRALDQARLLRVLVGSLAVGLRQAAYVGARPPTAPGCAEVLAALVAAVPPIDPDRPLEDDVRRAADVVEALER
jgi:histidine ammonia-lyase/tyrosine ammonia-lyase